MAMGNMVYGFRVFKASDCLWTYEVQTPVLGIAPPLGPKGPWKVNKPGVSGKAGAKDVPSWAKGIGHIKANQGKTLPNASWIKNMAKVTGKTDQALNTTRSKVG